MTKKNLEKIGYKKIAHQLGGEIDESFGFE
jgi:hypothetical protein